MIIAISCFQQGWLIPVQNLFPQNMRVLVLLLSSAFTSHVMIGHLIIQHFDQDLEEIN